MAQRQKLVVIGNGMAGARAVEEILARGGADQFEITMFGEEPYGNYNRILLSDVLNGSHDASEIFLNPLSWYETNRIKLHAGVKVLKIHRHARQVDAGSDRRHAGCPSRFLATRNAARQSNSSCQNDFFL